MVNCFNTALNISINNGILENISNPLLCFSVASQNKEKVVRDFLVDLFQNSRIKQRLVQAHFKHFNFRYHANIHKALKYAVKIDLIDVNPADKVERPKKDRYVGSFYDADEVNALFEAAKGSKLELPILFGAFYGLRRSEAIGLKWDAIICPPAGQSKRIPAKRIC